MIRISLKVLAALLVPGVCGLHLNIAPTSMNFANFVQAHGRDYAPEGAEWKKRQEIFERSKRKVIAHNAKPGQTWKMRLNAFSDWSDVEFRRMLGYKIGWRSALQSQMPSLAQQMGHDSKSTTDITTLPADVDWTSDSTSPTGMGCPVASSYLRNQGGCGSCWAVSSASAIECHLEANGENVAFHASHPNFTQEAVSSQAIVSCVQNPNNCGGTGGCDGATAELAFDYLVTVGLPLGTDYHYTSGSGSTGSCESNHRVAVTATSYTKLPTNDYTALMNALGTVGVVVVSVAATPWQLYSGGIMSECQTDGVDDWVVNHAVLAVGYGVDNGNKYWKIKNSWGDWGEAGYIRLSRTDGDQPSGIDTKPEEGLACVPTGTNASTLPKPRVNGTCGVLFDSSYPVNVTFTPTTAPTPAPST